MHSFGWQSNMNVQNDLYECFCVIYARCLYSGGHSINKLESTIERWTISVIWHKNTHAQRTNIFEINVDSDNIQYRFYFHLALDAWTWAHEHILSVDKSWPAQSKWMRREEKRKKIKLFLSNSVIFTSKHMTIMDRRIYRMKCFQHINIVSTKSPLTHPSKVMPKAIAAAVAATDGQHFAKSVRKHRSSWEK